MLQKQSGMKSKIITLAAAALFVVSCGTQKAAPVAAAEPAPPTATETAKAVTLTPELAEGQNLYENNCAKCHKLYDSKDFTAEEWTPIVMRMQKKARISDEQREKIYAYLTTPQM